MLLTNDQLTTLQATLNGLSGLDAELVQRCVPLFHSQSFDEAVARAFAVLEERMRKVLRVRGGTGRDLADKAFRPEKGVLVERLGLSAGEVEGIRQLFAGAFAAFRNAAAHRVPDYSEEEARGIVQLVNLLLLKLEQAREPAQAWMPREMMQALDARSRQRVEAFLRGLQRVGIARGKGKYWVPYKAQMRYLPEEWEEAKPHDVTLFYTLMSGSEPALGFNSTTLGRVDGLDLEQLESSLLQLGCVRQSFKDTPIRLFLLQRGDETTLGKLHAMLEELVQKHQ